MADAYKVKADVSLPRAVREVEELADGTKVYETAGVNYVAGDYVLAENITPFVREKAENGDLDHLLESVSEKEAKEALEHVETAVFIAEHEAEAVVLEEAGHQVVPRQQVLELKSAGADDAASALKAAKADGADERPALTASEVPSLAQVANDGVLNVGKDETPVDEEKLVQQNVEQPPGISVGEAKAQAEGGTGKRGRPKKAGQSDSPKSEDKA